MSDRFKVLHIHVMPVISGSGINTLISMVGVDAGRYEVEFACAPGGPLNTKAVEEGIAFHPINHFVQPISPWNDFIALIELIRLIRRERYHIIHTHNSKGGILGRVAARVCKTPIVIHTIHGFAFHDSETRLRKMLFIWLERWTATFTDKLIAISQPLQDWGLRLNIGKPDQYTKIYSGIEIEKFNVQINIIETRRELGLRENDLVIGLVAKLWDGKGHKIAIDALESIREDFPNAKLVFVGEGYLEADLKQMANEKGISDHVIFTGFRTDIAQLNSMLDIAILASDFEGMGRVLLEAMVMGKPIVASDVGGIPDVVDHGVTGFLVPPGNAKELASAVLKLLQSLELRNEMGSAGRKKINEQFSAATMVSKIADVYENQILENPLNQ